METLRDPDDPDTVDPLRPTEVHRDERTTTQLDGDRDTPMRRPQRATKRPMETPTDPHKATPQTRGDPQRQRETDVQRRGPTETPTHPKALTETRGENHGDP